MQWLNYHHLFYFWNVARLGSVTKASEELRLAQPTVSAQLKVLEDNLGDKLFERQGRNIRLTEAGAIAYRYCEQIFGLGTEMFEVIQGNSAGPVGVLRIGISDAVPKLLAYRMVDPLLSLAGVPKLIVAEDDSEKLLASLAIHELDVVISDCPIPPSASVKAYNHLIGTSGVTFLGVPALRKELARDFPLSLNNAPVLLPTQGSALRAGLDRWFHGLGLHPTIVAEFKDTALMKLFGKGGRGLFPVPTVIEADICRDMGVQVIGRIAESIEQIYIISTERRLKSPVVTSLVNNAQSDIFEEKSNGSSAAQKRKKLRKNRTQ